MKTDLFESCGHCWVFQICWHIECSTFTASSFRIWNSSTGIPSPPLALFMVMLPKAPLTSHSRMSGTRWVITPSWLSGSKFSKPGFSNMWTVNSRYSSWSYKRQRNQRSNCQHLLDHWKSNRVPEKHLFQKNIQKKHISLGDYKLNIVKYHYPPIRMAKIQNTDTKCWCCCCC